MPKKSFKKQKQYQREMREKAKTGVVNNGAGQWVKPTTSVDQMHLSGALHKKV